jgi:hypothetical protein
LGPAARAAVLQARRAEEAGHYAQRVRAAVDLPAAVLPLLALDQWGLEAVERIAEAVEAGLGSRC